MLQIKMSNNIIFAPTFFAFLDVKNWCQKLLKISQFAPTNLNFEMLIFHMVLKTIVWLDIRNFFWPGNLLPVINRYASLQNTRNRVRRVIGQEWLFHRYNVYFKSLFSWFLHAFCMQMNCMQLHANFFCCMQLHANVFLLHANCMQVALCETSQIHPRDV